MGYGFYGPLRGDAGSLEGRANNFIILELLVFCRDVTFGSLIAYNLVLQVAFCGFGFYVAMEGGGDCAG